jgi:glycerol uptake facilitator-like aquaporin
VTLAEALGGGLAWRDVPAYVLAQTAGAFAGAAIAHRPADAPAFIAAQLVGAAAGCFRWLLRPPRASSPR